MCARPQPLERAAHGRCAEARMPVSAVCWRGVKSVRAEGCALAMRIAWNACCRFRRAACALIRHAHSQTTALLATLRAIRWHFSQPLPEHTWNAHQSAYATGTHIRHAHSQTTALLATLRAIRWHFSQPLPEQTWNAHQSAYATCTLIRDAHSQTTALLTTLRAIRWHFSQPLPEQTWNASQSTYATSARSSGMRITKPPRRLCQ